MFPEIVVLPTPPMPVCAELTTTEPPHDAGLVVLVFTRAPPDEMPVPNSESGSAATAWPLRSSTAPLRTVVPPSPDPRAVALPTLTVPAATVVSPVKVLLPERIRVLVVTPDFVTEPAPEIVPASVWAAALENTSAPSLTIALENTPAGPRAPLLAIASVLPAAVSRVPLKAGLTAVRATLPLPSAASLPVPESVAPIDWLAKPV